MAINVKIQNQSNRLKPKITVIGVGGAGGNAVNNMITSHLEGCEFLVCNTDAQALEGNASGHKIQLGVNVTRGLGAGANPEIGRAAAEESIDDILEYLEGSNMVFVTAGMGGGTGTGAAPVIAQAAREAGILTVGVVTKPFHFEGTHRMKLAESGIAELQKHVDTLIIIPNQNLFRIANEKTTFADAFRMADEVLQSGVRGVTDLMVMPGLINLDFADIRAVMAEMGKAMMGTGEAEGERRAIEAAEAAISNPLLDDVSMKGARGVLINIMGGDDMTLFEVDEAANRIRDEVDPDANIIFGSTFDASLKGRMRVSVVATGIDVNTATQAKPLHLASAGVEPARRLAGAGVGISSKPQRASTTSGVGGYDKPVARTEYTGSIPSAIMPGQQSPYMAARTTMAGSQQPIMAGTGQSTMAQKQMIAADDVHDTATPETSMMMGHASSAPYAGAATATARKLTEQEMDETSTRNVTPPVAQTYQRAVPSMAQPRGMRHGNSFIPPKPVDPRTSTTTSTTGDLFGASPAPAAPAVEVEKPVKKAPTLFERFTMQRTEKEKPVVTAKTDTGTKLSVEEGGAPADDELDIPAFLRRQAN